MEPIVEMLLLADIRPSPRNPRQHSPSQIRKLAASLERFGWTVPILVDPENEIVAGHGRYLAAKSIAIEEAPVIRLSNLTPELIREYRVADNKLSELSEWDFDVLAAEIDALALDDYTAIGYDAHEIDSLRMLSEPIQPTEIPENVKRTNNNIDIFDYRFTAFVNIGGVVTKLPDAIADWLKENPIETLQEAMAHEVDRS